MVHEVASALFLSLLSAAPDPLQVWLRVSRTRDESQKCWTGAV